MSHAFGAVKCKDGTVYHFEYNGTVDICLPKLYKTSEEVVANWRKQEWENCPVGCKEHETATMATIYSKGFGWDVEICRKHMLIVDFHSSEAAWEYRKETRYEGLPDWYPKYNEETSEQ